MSLEHFPLARPAIPPEEIRQHVRRLNRGEADEPLPVQINYGDGSSKREKRILGWFGCYATFSNGDLAFTYDRHHTGLLMIRDGEVRISTASAPEFKGRG